MSKKYSHIIPANANIEIEYDSKEPVKFSYPIDWTYKKAVVKRAVPTIFAFFMLAFIKFLSLCFWIIFIPFLVWVNIGLSLNIYNSSDLIFTFTKIATFIDNNVNMALTIFMIFTCLAFFLPFVFALNKKLLSYLMPKFGYYTIVLMGRTKEKLFIFTEVENNKCIIPNFKNVFLNYKATEDFSKYLKKVKILSYDFKFHIRQRIAIFIKHKREQNDFIYYAVFEFSKQPFNGYLECEYY